MPKLRDDSDRAIERALTPIAHPIPDACRLTGLSKTFIYNQARAGKLRLSRVGRRTLVSHSELERLIREGQEAA